MRLEPGERLRTRCDVRGELVTPSPWAAAVRGAARSRGRRPAAAQGADALCISGVRSIAGRAASRRRGLHQVPRWFATCCVGMLADLRQAANTGPRVPITDCSVMIC